MKSWGAVTLDEVKRQDLADLIIKKNCIIVRETPIKLASGILSDHYYNIKSVSLDPKGSTLIGQLGAEVISELTPRPKSVGGLESGAIPIVTAIVRECNNTANPIPGFFVRKAAKGHGLDGPEEMIDGNKPESPVLIVDDVTTTGDSVSKAIKQVQRRNYQIIGVLTIIDRQDGSKETFERLGIPLFPVFTDNYFKDHIEYLRQINKREIETRVY